MSSSVTEGVKLTYMPMITEAVAKALVTYPQLNVSVDGYNILFKKHINVGIAVSLNDGNLIVRWCMMPTI